MINVHAFIKSLKVSWVRRIFCGPECQWLTLFNEMYTYTRKLHFESMWGNVLIKRMSSAFWVEVIENWQILYRKQQPISNSDLMNTSIRYNPKISREPLYFSNWFNAGVSLLGDVLDDNGKIESFETLQKTYSINCNILDYCRITLSVQNFVKKFSFEESFNYSRPSCPFHLRILFKSSKGVKDFYQIFLSNPGLCNAKQ